MWWNPPLWNVSVSLGRRKRACFHQRSSARAPYPVLEKLKVWDVSRLHGKRMQIYLLFFFLLLTRLISKIYITYKSSLTMFLSCSDFSATSFTTLSSWFFWSCWRILCYVHTCSNLLNEPFPEFMKKNMIGASKETKKSEVTIGWTPLYNCRHSFICESFHFLLLWFLFVGQDDLRCS